MKGIRSPPSTNRFDENPRIGNGTLCSAGSTFAVYPQPHPPPRSELEPHDEHPPAIPPSSGWGNVGLVILNPDS